MVTVMVAHYNFIFIKLTSSFEAVINSSEVFDCRWCNYKRKEWYQSDIHVH